MEGVQQIGGQKLISFSDDDVVLLGVGTEKTSR
jgi:hypothetical protein